MLISNVPSLLSSVLSSCPFSPLCPLGIIGDYTMDYKRDETFFFNFLCLLSFITFLLPPHPLTLSPFHPLYHRERNRETVLDGLGVGVSDGERLGLAFHLLLAFLEVVLQPLAHGVERLVIL